MVKLIAKSPFGDALPINIGSIDMTEIDLGPVTFIQPLKGREPEVSEALRQAVGLGFPAPGSAKVSDAVRVMWCGPFQALLLGATVHLEGAAAIDQTDAWAAAKLTGAGVLDLLARLTPLDVRPSKFEPGQTARTLIGHMSGQITCVGPDAYEIMVFRSMAGTLVHDIHRAASFVQGRAKLGLVDPT